MVTARSAGLAVGRVISGVLLFPVGILVGLIVGAVTKSAHTGILVGDIIAYAGLVLILYTVLRATRFRLWSMILIMIFGGVALGVLTGVLLGALFHSVALGIIVGAVIALISLCVLVTVGVGIARGTRQAIRSRPRTTVPGRIE
jgi:hypothetical protein